MNDAMMVLQKASRTFHDSSSLSKLLALFTVSGGALAVAYIYANRSTPQKKKKKKKKKRVVVLGTGLAGTAFLKRLDNPSYEVQAILPLDEFAFTTPPSPSVNMVKKKNVDVLYSEAECLMIDSQSKKVHCRSSTQNVNGHGNEEFKVEYDYLVIAMEGCPNSFNTPGVVEYCTFLKEVEDAHKIRRSVADAFQKASLPSLTDEERTKMLHFVVVGGGPTGLEFAAELHDFVAEDLMKLYPDARKYVKITLLEAADHILTMFDKRIVEFAEDKFKRDGIDVKLGSMVTKVSDKEISVKARVNGQVNKMPYGMVIWSTEIGVHPVIRDFLKEVGQGNKRALATDEWLRVEGTDNVYALGDCATINQRKVLEYITAIFNKADNDNSGTLTVKELQEAVSDICERYPQVDLYLKTKKLRNISDLLKAAKGDDAKGSIELSIEELKRTLKEVDFEFNFLPAIAQVAARQGAYLAKCFNRMEEAEKNPEGPLRFRGEGRHRFHPFRSRGRPSSAWHGTIVNSMVLTEAVLVGNDTQVTHEEARPINEVMQFEKYDKSSNINVRFMMGFSGTGLFAHYFVENLKTTPLSDKLDDCVDRIVKKLLAMKKKIMSKKGMEDASLDGVVAGVDYEQVKLWFISDELESKQECEGFAFGGCGEPYCADEFEDGYRKDLTIAEAVELSMRGIYRASIRDFNCGGEMVVRVLEKGDPPKFTRYTCETKDFDKYIRTKGMNVSDKTLLPPKTFTQKVKFVASLHKSCGDNAFDGDGDEDDDTDSDGDEDDRYRFEDDDMDTDDFEDDYMDSDDQI